MTDSQALVPAGDRLLDLPPVTRPDQHPAAVYLASLAPGSRRTMRQALDTIADVLTSGRCDAETMDWPAVRYQHVQGVRAALAERYKAATANKMLVALRRVLKECWRLELMDAETYHKAADVQQVTGSTLLRGRALASGELRALFADCAADPTPAGKRDAALLAVLYGAGLRRAEAAALGRGDVDPETGAVTVLGKGNKQRTTYLAGGGLRALVDWLAVRGDGPGPLFYPIDKAGRLTARGMTTQAVLKILVKRGGRARVAAFSPHDLRRSFVSDLLDAGADIATVQKLAGHASPQTTARYDRRGEAAKRKAAGLLHVPY